jgi:voltage-gated potassium channel
LKSFWQFLLRENIVKLFIVVLGITLSSGLIITWFEPNISLASGLWWSIVTLTTVGYGDISPESPAGRILAIIIMFFGIGLLSTLSASLAALIISHRLKENKGMCAADFQDHLILCEWNHRSRAIIKELRTDSHTKDLKIVLIANIDEKPLDDHNLFFVKGSVSEETLEKANIVQAKTIIVLGDDSLDAISRDAKVVLATLTIESIAHSVYSVVELVDEANVMHCRRAQADEIIVGSVMSSRLIASAAIDHGISRVVSELLSTQYGNELFSIPLPDGLVGNTFLDVFTMMKRERQSIVLGVLKEHNGEHISNPPSDYIFEKEDRLIVVSNDRVAMSDSMGSS